MAAVDPVLAHRQAALSAARAPAPPPAHGGWNPADYARNAAFVPAMGAAALELLAPQPGERILDLGCGDGVLTSRIAQAGAHVTGLDSDAAMLAAARARGLQVLEGSGEALAFDGTFDAVFSNAALHWMLDADAVVRGVFAALRPGGRFVGECGGHGNVAAIRVAIRSVLERHGQPWREAQRYATADGWTLTLARAGFIHIEAQLISRPTPLPTGIAGWLETFRIGFLHDAPPAVLAEIETLLAPMLRDPHGHWTADYVRLRFSARRPA